MVPFSKNSRKKQKRTDLFTYECTAAITRRKPYNNIYHKEQCNRTPVVVRTVQNYCKIILENKKSCYEQASRPWSKANNAISNQILNKRIKHGPTIISSLTNKTKLIGIIFASDSMLDKKKEKRSLFPGSH